MPTRILITGGAGNVGGSLAERLSANPENYVVVVDNLLTGSRSKLPPSDRANWAFIRGDVNEFRDISPIMTSYQFDYVFHYAAVVGVRRTLEHPTWVLRDIDGIRNVLSLAKNTGVRRVFFSSSSEVYGEPVEIPQIEDTTPLNSRLPYAIVKNVGEAFFKSFQQEFGLPYTIFRFFNTYGPRQSDDFVIPRFVRQALSHSDITIYGDGTQTRTFCFVDDNMEATERAMENDLCVNEVINVGSDIEISVVDLARTIIRLTNSRSKIVHVPALLEGDMTRRCPDISKMMAVLGRELTPLDVGLRRTIDSYGI